MNWMVYDPDNNKWLRESDKDGYPSEWAFNKIGAKHYGDKEIVKVMTALKKFGFDRLEQVGFVKRG